jgi:hypothetical protein
VSKSKRPPQPEGPDRLARPAEEVRTLLNDRLRLGRHAEDDLSDWSHMDSNEGLVAGKHVPLHLAIQVLDLLADVSKWSSTTETAIEHLFVGSKSLSQFKAATLVGTGVVNDSITQRWEDGLDRHRRRLRVLESIIEGIPYMGEAAPSSHRQSRPKQSWSDRPVFITMQSGNVNLGTVVGNVTSNVSGLTGTDAEVIKVLMGQLAKAVVDSELEAETKAESGEAVEVVSEALKAGAGRKPSAMVRSAFRRLPALLQTADQALQVWSELQGVIGPHLPPGTM